MFWTRRNCSEDSWTRQICNWVWRIKWIFLQQHNWNLRYWQKKGVARFYMDELSYIAFLAELCSSSGNFISWNQSFTWWCFNNRWSFILSTVIVFTTEFIKAILFVDTIDVNKLQVGDIQITEDNHRPSGVALEQREHEHVFDGIAKVESDL